MGDPTRGDGVVAVGGRSRWRKWQVAIAVIVGCTAIPSAVDAVPSESQNLRGLGDRVFEVHVVGWAYDEVTFQPVEYEFDSCQVFQADGTFIDPAFPDPAFPVPGTWSQQRVGAATPYAAEIEFDVGGGFVLSLDQAGDVRPGPGGVLGVTADTVLTLTFNGAPLPGFDPWGEFVSVGFENPDCLG